MTTTCIQTYRRNFSGLIKPALFSPLMMLLAISGASAQLPTVTDQEAVVDSRAISDMPKDAAVNALNLFQPRSPTPALTPTLRDNLARYRCRFGTEKTAFMAVNAKLPNAQLRYYMKRVTVNETLRKQGMLNGIGVRVEPAERAADNWHLPHCALAFFPEGYPADDLSRELNRLATALTAIGITPGNNQ